MREAILKILKGDNIHPNLKELKEMIEEEMGQEIDDLKLKKELLVMNKEDLIRGLLLFDHNVSYEGRMDEHYHFICDCCGEVKDIVLEKGASTMIIDHAQKVINSSAKIDQVNMSFRGTCHVCRKEDC